MQPSVEAIEAASETALAATDSAPADLLGGLAGVVHGLVAALPYDLDGCWRSRAFELGRALLASASGAPAGICWPTSPGSAEHLCGLARGAAGVALALARLAALAPEAEGWAKAAAAARGYERGWFSPEHASWADLRQDALGPGGPGYPQLWCHGSVGIAHERLRATAAGLADPLCRADAAAAFLPAPQRPPSHSSPFPQAQAAATGRTAASVTGSAVWWTFSPRRTPLRLTLPRCR